ncbi:large-conductance mechanosensitive channel protein MscL [Lysobacter sp. TY2-98]|uniref:large-conductance mechanosensitive channel protein MscL n=1 Tax=Lysobacter sp. TY2-98 TaxID=2290922 RepID=UPI000E1FE84A|nr:large-conductance mechanosensitive channel protein MscL [Lysobacter sp. TY2-98]AXK71301.1 large-conductance mechanosensitive channel protein MscL [Lysobacter sp. TY2-98]
MRFLDEFKAFIARGNVVDLAVGVVIGAAFGKIVSALVDGLVMPVIAMATGGVRVDQWKVVLKPAMLDAAGKVATPEVALKYGAVLQATLDFLIIAFVIFLVLRAYNRLRKPAEDAPAAPPEDVVLLTEIRDLLKAKSVTPP